MSLRAFQKLPEARAGEQKVTARLREAKEGRERQGAEAEGSLHRERPARTGQAGLEGARKSVLGMFRSRCSPNHQFDYVIELRDILIFNVLFNLILLSALRVWKKQSARNCRRFTISASCLCAT